VPQDVGPTPLGISCPSSRVLTLVVMRLACSLFGRYFTTSASLPSQAWAVEEDVCGHCGASLDAEISSSLLMSPGRLLPLLDNCTRSQENVTTLDCTLAAWKM
jgi:hypothetical protein